MASNAPTLSTGLSTGVDAMAVDPPAIDEDLQSRQMAVYGRESMQMLRRADVLISGLNGLGAEVAKNVILANVKSVNWRSMNCKQGSLTSDSMIETYEQRAR